MTSLSDRRSWLVPIALLIVGITFVLVGVLISRPRESGPAARAPVPDSTDEILRVSMQDAIAAYESGSAVFVDVRSASAYEEASIPASRSIPIGEIEQRAAELNPEAWIITVCT